RLSTEESRPGKQPIFKHSGWRGAAVARPLLVSPGKTPQFDLDAIAMSSPPQAHIDELILSFARTDWRKMAMIISRVFLHCRDTGIEIDQDDFDLRIAERI